MLIHKILILTFVASSVFGAEILEREKHPNTRDLIESHGYPAEFHQVKTEDGNSLALFRIPHSPKLPNQSGARPIVLLQHGLLSSSDIWVLCGPDNALPYLLADAGFDVWIGNNRGNQYSLELATPAWNYSFHEIGIFDVAAMIDYALKTNGQDQKSLHYVGHSQGSTAFLTLTSLRPDYNDKIKTAHLLSPVAIWKNSRIKCFDSIGDGIGLTWMKIRLSNKKFTGIKSLISFSRSLQKRRCFEAVGNCMKLWDNIYSKHSNKTAVEEAKNISQVASGNQLLHYFFNYNSGRFRQYDYETKKNLKVYKSEQPPEYPVENISSMVHLWYVDSDDLLAPSDVLALAERLPNKEVHHIVEDPIFAHSDYVVHNQARIIVNEPILQIMQQYELNEI